MKKEGFYLAQELADKLRVNVMTIYRYIKAGKLKAYKIGKEFRIENIEYEKFLTSVKTKAGDLSPKKRTLNHAAMANFCS